MFTPDPRGGLGNRAACTIVAAVCTNPAAPPYASNRPIPCFRRRLQPIARMGTPLAYYARRRPNRTKEPAVDLTSWIPLTLGLGAVALGLMALFVEACDRV
jgi:hypothetical protein